MDYSEARDILIRVLTDTVAETVRAYLRKCCSVPGEQQTSGTKDTSVITAWYDPDEYNCFEFAQKYKVLGSSITNRFARSVTIKFNGVDDYTLCVPCSDSKFSDLNVFFSKNSNMLYSGNETNSESAYVIYEEDVLKNRECKDFLLNFMEDTFPEEKGKIEEIFRYFQ